MEQRHDRCLVREIKETSNASKAIGFIYQQLKTKELCQIEKEA